MDSYVVQWTLKQSKIQAATFGIWTRLLESSSYDYNRHAAPFDLCIVLDQRANFTSLSCILLSVCIYVSFYVGNIFLVFFDGSAK